LGYWKLATVFGNIRALAKDTQAMIVMMPLDGAPGTEISAKNMYSA
jgi:hypothetical protein